jgi:hypothetical protein
MVEEAFDVGFQDPDRSMSISQGQKECIYSIFGTSVGSVSIGMSIGDLFRDGG